MSRTPHLTFILLLITTAATTSSVDFQVASDTRASITSSDNQAIGLSFELSDLERSEVVKDGATFETYTIPGEGLALAPGKPVLPAISRFVVVPPDVGLDLVVESDDPVQLSAEQPPTLYSEGDLEESDEAEHQGLYPPVIAEMSEPSIIRGVRVVKVTVYPVQYNQSSGNYLHRNNIQTEIRYTMEEPVNPVQYPNRRNRSQQFLKYIDALTINGDIVGRDDPDRDIDPPYVGHYLVVIPEPGLQYVAPFIEWRRKSGYKVDILSLSEGDARSSNTVGNEIQERYDAYIDEDMDPFEYVLLVGDRNAYENPPAPGWILEAEQGQTCWPQAYHADYLFGCLEGNDQYPDVGISRWPGGSEAMLELMVGRTLGYEATPYMEDTTWFTRGGVYSQHWGNVEPAWHVSIHTNVRWGVGVLQSLGFDDIEFYEDYQWDQDGDRIGPWTADRINDRTNVLIGRSENYYYPSRGAGAHDFNRDVEETNVFPIDINTCGHGEWARETMYRVNGGNGNNLKGYVATSYGWAFPTTIPMSAVWLEFVNAVMLRDLPYGWGRTMAITAFEAYIPDYEDRNNPIYRSVKTDIDAFGDPGIQPWIGVPRQVEALFPETITPEVSIIQVQVSDQEDESEVEGARVTLYCPGDMPAFDDEAYAEYNDMFMKTTLTDASGWARFVFDDEDDFEGDVMYLTVTGRDICPLFEEIEVNIPEVVVELMDFELTEQEGGNGDDLVNPNETFTLRLTAGNLGDGGTAEDVTAAVSSNSPWVEIDEDNEFSFGDILLESNVESEDAVTIVIHPACPDGASRPITRPVLLIDFSSGEQSWQSAIKLNPRSPNLEVATVVDGEVIPAEDHNLDIEIVNKGAKSVSGVWARLSTKGMGVSVVQSAAQYRDFNPDQQQGINGNPFIVSGNQIVPPGFRNEMMIVFTCSDDFVDTAYFELQKEDPRANAPSPPDQFGYMCYDDSDDDWEIAPDYNWIEICPDEDWEFLGTEIEFEGEQRYDEGLTAVIDLGFISRLYGYEFDQITVTTNGFISIGDQSMVPNYQNWPLDRAIGGGVGMMAVFWDDLRVGDEAGVFYYYDADNAYMIVEWHNLRHRSGGHTDLTFQAIVHDADVWVMDESRNPPVIFQYKSIENVQNVRAGDTAWNHNTPYASIGISSPDGYGINYTFADDYPVWAAEIEDRRAIMFITTPRFKAGCIEGWVTDVRTEQPVEGVMVYTEHGFRDFTDEEGYYFIEDALAEIDFNITASKLGYNDSTYVDTFLAEHDTIEINFALLHPEFDPSTRSISRILEPEHGTDVNFSLTNPGNGPLYWSMRRRLPRGADAAPWEFRLSYPVGEVVNDSRIEGVVFADSLFYVAGANYAAGIDEPNTIYILNKDGELLDTFPQPDTLNGDYGMKDLAWDGELIWGSGCRRIAGMNLEGEVVVAFDGPYPTNRSLAWDPDRRVLWVSDITQGITAVDVDREGEVDTTLNRKGFRIYGLAYWEDDPDGYPLYIFHNPADCRQHVHKMNPDNGDTIFVADLGSQVAGSAGGVFITNQYDVYSWVFINIANDADGDRIDIWQLDARRDWFRVYTEVGEDEIEIEADTVDADQTQEFRLKLSSVDLPPVLFRGFLVFSHNAGGGVDTLFVDLNVIGPVPPTPFALLYPEDNATINANDSTEVTFVWTSSVDYNEGDEVSYQTWFRSGNDSSSTAVADTFLTANILELADSLELSIEEEWALTWWVMAVSGEDAVAADTHFVLNFVPNAVPLEGSVPVEFGLRSIYPSPFNSQTTVRFGMDRPERVTLKVYDLQGREAVILYDGASRVGYTSVVWDASQMPSGLYVIRIVAAGRSQTAKVALVR